jgi:hypothetical protein
MTALLAFKTALYITAWSLVNFPLTGKEHVISDVYPQYEAPISNELQRNYLYYEHYMQHNKVRIYCISWVSWAFWSRQYKIIIQGMEPPNTRLFTMHSPYSTINFIIIIIIYLLYYSLWLASKLPCTLLPFACDLLLHKNLPKFLSYIVIVQPTTSLHEIHSQIPI